VLVRGTLAERGACTCFPASFRRISCFFAAVVVFHNNHFCHHFFFSFFFPGAISSWEGGGGGGGEAIKGRETSSEAETEAAAATAAAAAVPIPCYEVLLALFRCVLSSACHAKNRLSKMPLYTV
jgi:hypothetical protein